jgi:outer membrane protein OmpA-like peptidoglycan-associated protein
MKPSYRFYILASLLLNGWISLFALASAQTVGGAGTTSANFLKIGMGSRAAAMGDAFVAVSNDPSAIFWNPAGLDLTHGLAFSLSQAEWLDGIQDGFIAFSNTLGQDGAIGGSLTYLTTGAFQSTLQTPTGAYGGLGAIISANDFAGSLAYAQNLGHWWPSSFWNRSYLGLRMIILGQQILNQTNYALAFNLGYLYELIKNQLNLGFVLENLGTSLSQFDEPTAYKMGAAYTFSKLLTSTDQLILAVQGDYQIDTAFKEDLGTEYKLGLGSSAVFLRAGYVAGGDLGTVTGLTTGMGIWHQFASFSGELDYALVPYGILGTTNRLTLTIQFNPVLPAPRAWIRSAPTLTLTQTPDRLLLQVQSTRSIQAWRVGIFNARGIMIQSWQGSHQPPAFLIWKGHNQTGGWVSPGHYRLEFQIINRAHQSALSQPAWVQVLQIHPVPLIKELYHFRLPSDLLFSSGQVHLSSKSRPALDQLIQRIKQAYPQAQILIVGHTDNVPVHPNARYTSNQQLSLIRAQSVMQAFIDHGFSPQNLKAQGVGNQQPLVSNQTAAGRAQNRRVDIIVYGSKAQSESQILQQGIHHFKQGQVLKALNLFISILNQNTHEALAYYWAGNCYLRLGATQEAFQAYQKALQLRPQWIQLRQWLNQHPQSAQPKPQ